MGHYYAKPTVVPGGQAMGIPHSAWPENPVRALLETEV
jgi:hypothetical protein